MLDHIKQQQELQKSRIAASYGEIEKGGEGSGRKKHTVSVNKQNANGLGHGDYHYMARSQYEAEGMHIRKYADKDKNKGVTAKSHNSGLKPDNGTDSTTDRKPGKGLSEGQRAMLEEAGIYKNKIKKSTSIEEHQSICKSRIANSIGGERISDEDLEKSANDFLEKGHKGEPIGTQKTFGGRNYIKTASGWKYHGKGTGAKAQEHVKAALDHHVSAAKGFQPGDKVKVKDGKKK